MCVALGFVEPKQAQIRRYNPLERNNYRKPKTGIALTCWYDSTTRCHALA